MLRGLFTRFGLAAFMMASLQAVANAGPVAQTTGLSEKADAGYVLVANEIKVAAAEKEAKPAADGKYKEDGKYFDKDDNPTYNKNDKDEWDWLTYNGNRRYHAECHVCHGPLGLGSSFAPALATSLKTMSYDDFREVVTNGRSVKQTDGSSNVMPTFGTNKNVMCFLDDLYVYLKARADGAMGKVFHRDLKKEAKPKEIREEEAACFGE